MSLLEKECNRHRYGGIKHIRIRVPGQSITTWQTGTGLLPGPHQGRPWRSRLASLYQVIYKLGKLPQWASWFEQPMKLSPV